MEDRKKYPTDLNDKEWALIEPLLPDAQMGRPRKYSQRELMNALLYIARTGCSWRLLPHDLPPWKSVYAYLRKLQESGVLAEINQALHTQLRIASGRSATPSTVIVDSQSVKTSEKGGLEEWTPGKR